MKFISIFLNRNFILMAAIVAGLALGDEVSFLNHFSLYILGAVMAFSATSLATNELLPVSNAIRISASSVLLNFIVFPTIILTAAWFLIPDKLIFYGFVVIAASPAGAAIIPFTTMLGGDLKYSIIGVSGIYLASVFITPFMIEIFTAQSSLSSFQLLMMMMKVIIIPLFISRLLLVKSLKHFTVRWRGKITDLGFALIIIGAVGSNQNQIFTDYQLMLICAFILMAGIFVPGILFHYISTRHAIPLPRTISMNMMLTIKSSAFTTAASFALFGPAATLPSAVLAVVVLLYLIFLGFLYPKKNNAFT